MCNYETLAVVYILFVNFNNDVMTLFGIRCGDVHNISCMCSQEAFST